MLVLFSGPSLFRKEKCQISPLFLTKIPICRKCFRIFLGENTSRTTLIVQSLFVRTLFQAGKLELLRDLDRFRYDIVALSEVRWTDTEHQLGGRFIYAGELQKRELDVAFMLTERVRKSLVQWNKGKR